MLAGPWAEPLQRPAPLEQGKDGGHRWGWGKAAVPRNVARLLSSTPAEVGDG